VVLGRSTARAPPQLDAQRLDELRVEQAAQQVSELLDVRKRPGSAIEQCADEGDGTGVDAGHLTFAWTANRQSDAVAERGALRA
jgi:hypothetical protein